MHILMIVLFFFSGIYQLPLIHCLDFFPRNNSFQNSGWVQNVKGLDSAMCQAIRLNL